MRRLPPGPSAAAVLVSIAAVAIVSAAVGAVSIPAGEVVRILLGASILPGLPPDPTHEAVLMQIRLPRIGLGLIVGASLGASGALLQGLLRNPLADPGLVGVSSGAALAAAIAAVFGFGGGVQLPLSAFIGGLVASLSVLWLVERRRAPAISDLVLAGVGVNAMCGAFVGLVIFVADDAALRSFTFWTLGSLGGASPSSVALAALGAGLPTLAAVSFSRRLDLLMLGEVEARTLGVSVRQTRGAAVLCCALAVGTGVAFCGIIGFIGLIAPHLVRMISGPMHRVVLPGSALVGALLLLCADLVARSAAAPLEIPLGVVTTLIGGPFLLGLLARSSA